MQRRAPGRLTEPPYRGWPGALVAAMTLFAVVTLSTIGGVAVAATSTSTKRKARSATASTTTTTVPSDAASEDGADVDERGPFAVRTVSVQLYDATRDRTINVTVYAPD